MNIFIKNYAHLSWLGKLLIVVLFGVQLSSCEKALEPEYPDSLLSETAVFENETTVDAALATVYASLRDNSPVSGGVRGMNVLLGLYADELNYYREDAQIDNAFYNHTVLPNNTAVADFWNSSYTLIYNTNSIIEGLKTSTIEPSQKEQFMGEAYFLRAYVHAYLAKLFGDIPYIKTTNHTENATVSRLPLQTVYQSVEQDLKTAKNLLPSVETSGERLRVSKSVATAMLARLHLISGQWKQAYNESNAVIADGTYIWQPDLNSVFLKESPSTIWQLKPEFEGSGTKEGETFIFDFGPPFLYALTQGFMTDFEPGDLRREAWTREITDGSVSWYHPFKYKQNMFGGSSTEYSVLFRLAEQYLIRAESALQLGDLQLAKDDINTIRLRAGLAPTPANTVEELQNELSHQVRYELFTEQGHRWFNLKRTETASQVLGSLKPGWKNTDVLLPIPQQELILNPNLKPQNPGY